MTIQELYENAKTSNKPLTTLITKGQQSKLIGIGLGKDVILSEHKAPGPTKLIVVKGKVEYKTASFSIIINELEEHTIPLEELHSAKGLEHSVFFLSVNM